MASDITTVSIPSSIKKRYEEIFKKLYGVKPSISDKVITTLEEEIERMEKELEERNS